MLFRFNVYSIYYRVSDEWDSDEWSKGGFNLKKETLYSPIVLILALLILVLKGILDYQLDGSISMISYLRNNFLYILPMIVYVVRFINFNK